MVSVWVPISVPVQTIAPASQAGCRRLDPGLPLHHLVSRVAIPGSHTPQIYSRLTILYVQFAVDCVAIWISSFSDISTAKEEERHRSVLKNLNCRMRDAR